MPPRLSRASRANRLTEAGLSLETWKHLPRLAASLWGVSPALLSAIVALRFLRALQVPAMLFVGKVIIDEVVLQAHQPAPGPDFQAWWLSGRLSALAGWLVLELALTAAGNIIGRLTTLAENLIAEQHSNRMARRLIEHVARLDLQDIEDSAFQDKLQRARAQTFIGNGLLGMMLNQLQDTITVVALVAGLIVFVPALVFVLVLALLPAAVSEAYFNSKRYGLNHQVTSERRRIEYLRAIGSNPDYAKEVKLFGLGSYLVTNFVRLADMIHAANRALAIRSTLWGSGMGLLSSLAYYAAYAYVAWRAVTGSISIGDLTFLSGSLLRLNGLFERLTLGLTQIASQTAYLDDLFSFLDTQPGMQTASSPLPFPSPLRHGIVFEDVGFRYPGKDSWALRHLSFALGASETVALVGENGAGKTTIVKLLARLYDPDEGRITIDGIDLRAFDLDDLRAHIGVIFQDFVRYNLSVAHNIGIGRTAQMDDRERVTSAAQASLADELVRKMPEGYEQMIGRGYDRGYDLSGGEWQKLAIARAYFRDAEVLILDEPTAALDARAEAGVFDRFRNLSQNKSTLLISHRFTTVRMADRIIVLENGGILEAGDHATLMTLGGRYAELFNLQAAGYR
ncbi:MAG: transporter ATP-binding protein [Hyphomicrobiales bacterium]|nr:transporter ATP-binding protein [Hyphomicrobiales bacterium]